MARLLLVTGILWAWAGPETAWADRFTDISAREEREMSFPAGRCGGHAQTGACWTAPDALTADISGAAWTIRGGAPTKLILWVKETRLIDRTPVRARSDKPYQLVEMVSDIKGDPGTLRNISFAAGDQVCVQIGGNSFAGIDLVITSRERT